MGVFPEQAENWDWIAERVDQCHRSGIEKPRVLNLFAYTGGSTLAAAAAGAEVVHIDASKSTVAWARRNAELSALSTAPIRWICEDRGALYGASKGEAIATTASCSIHRRMAMGQAVRRGRLAAICHRSWRAVDACWSRTADS